MVVKIKPTFISAGKFATLFCNDLHTADNDQAHRINVKLAFVVSFMVACTVAHET